MIKILFIFANFKSRYYSFDQQCLPQDCEHMAGRSYDVRTYATYQSGGCSLSLPPLGKPTAISSIRPHYSCRQSFKLRSSALPLLKEQLHTKIKDTNHLSVKNTHRVYPSQPQQFEYCACWWLVYIHNIKLGLTSINNTLKEKKKKNSLLTEGNRQHPIFLYSLVHASKGSPFCFIPSPGWTILTSTICRLSAYWCLPAVQLDSCLHSRLAPRDSKFSALPGLLSPHQAQSFSWKALPAIVALLAHTTLPCWDSKGRCRRDLHLLPHLRLILFLLLTFHVCPFL